MHRKDSELTESQRKFAVRCVPAEAKFCS